MEKLKKAKEDIFLMIGCFVLGLVLHFVIIPDQIVMTKKVAEQPFTPATLPELLAAALCLVSAFGFVSALMKYRKAKAALTQEELAALKGAKEKVERSSKEKLAPFIPFIFFVLVLIYGLLFDKIGFIPATVIMPALLLLLLGCKKPLYYGVVYAVIAVIYVIFKFVLSVPLP